MSFAGDLDKFGKKTKENFIKVKRAASLDLFAAVVMETPVDKGVLRANWFVNVGSPDRNETTDSDRGGQATISAIEQGLNAANEENDIFLNNNLPYAYAIEFDGISGKAPNGMVRVNAARWDSIVANNIKKVTSGG
jgi:hypothetical protein